MSEYKPTAEKIPGSLWGVASVWRRHALIFRRTWLINLIPPMSEPIFYLLSFGFGLSPMIGKFMVNGVQLDYLKFIAPGMVAVGICFQAFFEGAYGTFIRLKFQKTWHGLLTAPLGFREIYLGDLLWAATRGFVAGVVTALVTLAMGLITFSAFLAMLPIILLGSLTFGALGVMVSGCIKTIDQINIPVFLFIVPMFTFSGTFYPRENLPAAFANIAGVLPLANLVDLLRMPIIYTVKWPIDVGILIAWMIVPAVIGYKLIYRQIFR